MDEVKTEPCSPASAIDADNGVHRNDNNFSNGIPAPLEMKLRFTEEIKICASPFCSGHIWQSSENRAVCCSFACSVKMAVNVPELSKQAQDFCNGLTSCQNIEFVVTLNRAKTKIKTISKRPIGDVNRENNLDVDQAQNEIASDERSSDIEDSSPNTEDGDSELSGANENSVVENDVPQVPPLQNSSLRQPADLTYPQMPGAQPEYPSVSLNSGDHRNIFAAASAEGHTFPAQVLHPQSSTEMGTIYTTTGNYFQNYAYARPQRFWAPRHVAVYTPYPRSSLNSQIYAAPGNSRMMDRQIPQSPQFDANSGQTSAIFRTTPHVYAGPSRFPNEYRAERNQPQNNNQQQCPVYCSNSILNSGQHNRNSNAVTSYIGSNDAGFNHDMYGNIPANAHCMDGSHQY